MIQKLPPHLIHQIAAGEVIERPASVLKELIENSLDASSSSLTLRFRAGGKDFLEIEDDGQGIAEEQLSLAFESHATSKLKSMDDFDRLQTYGFRGEALASIGSVADVCLETSTLNSPRGSKLRNLFGQIFDCEAIDKRIGTKISVKNLFDRLPGRREFLKSDRSESTALWSMIKKYMLARPEIRFEVQDLDGDKKKVLAPGSFFDRALLTFGSHEPDFWYQVEEGEELEAVGIAPRYVTRLRGGIYLFLNSRPIRDNKIEAAIRRAYEGFTEFPREATVALSLKLSPREFDVNVHPMKTEVRFKDPDRIFSLVHRSLKNKFLKSHQSQFPLRADTAQLTSSESPGAVRNAETPTLNFNVAPVEPSHTNSVESPNMRAGERARPLFASAPSTFEYLFSIDSTFLVCRRGTELVLFDQHALHERVLYEDLLKQWTAHQKISSQRLLFPVTLSWPQVEELFTFEERANQMGFEIRALSGGRVSVVAVPAILKKNPEAVLKALLESWEGGAEMVLRDVLATMACHAAVRAHDNLSSDEIRRLLMDFQTEDSLGHCPHGRPTFVHLGVRDLEKMFHRVI